MFPILNFALMFIIPIIVVGIAKIIDNKRNSNIGNFNNIFEEEKAALEGIIEEKISEVKDNAIDLEIAVKKAGFISKSMEEDLAKLNTKIESYKDYKAAVSQYQEQVDSLEEAYLDILNKVDTVLKERNTIEKTYKRISDVKTKMIELEKNVSTVQDKLIDSYNSKFNDFESELYKRFDALTSNLLARDAHYIDMAEQEKEKISALTEEFKLHVAKKEELFTNQLTQLAERTARNNIEQLAELFEKSREELINKYSLFADEIDFKSKDIEERFEVISQSKDGLENELINLRDTIHDRLNSITESSILEFKDEMEKTKEMLYSSLREGLEKITQDKEEFLESIEQKAVSLEQSIDYIKDKADFISKDYEERTSQLDSDFVALKDDINRRLLNEVEAFSNNIRDVLENENNGIITLYRNKTKELSDLIIALDGMSEETLLKAESRFEEISNDIEKLKNDILLKTQDDMEYSIDNARGSLIAEINELRADVEGETNLLKEKIEEIHYQTSEFSSILTNKQEEILDSLSLEKEYLYKDLENQANNRMQELQNQYNYIKDNLEGNIDNYIRNTASELEDMDNKLSILKEKYNEEFNNIDSLSKDMENHIKENTEKRIELNDMINNLESSLEDFKNRVNNIVDENIKYSEDNKKNIVDMLHNELHKATESFNSLLEGKRDDMNKIRDELEDIMHRLEIGKESFEKTINGVYEKADNKEKELVSDIENKYNNLDKKIETLFDEKKTDLNNMSAKYHSERTFARKRAIHI